MQWEQLTSTGFAEAVKETGVCILPLGVLEKHSEHLPLGTDFLNAHGISVLAAEKEPAVVFPPFYFGQIYEARCFPGTFTIKPTLLLELFQSVFDEIGRNGFKKIILYNTHGGNWHFLQFLNQCSLWEEKSYQVYLYVERLSEEIKALTGMDQGHADEWETTLSHGISPNLTQWDKVPKEPALPLGRLSHIPNAGTGIHWYAEYPDHYAGDARKASAELSKPLVDLHVSHFASFISAVKKDEAVAGLNAEFFGLVREVSGGQSKS
ncbi:creatininase family protein [Cohnella sp. WQ 127256]|uniref:creatininase family protein n=1 Tax=Cohnella sp. WQ 127256 TaxID=2938790 RepID=UPI0021188DCE|nr:creatininase family protein [Cohnella sp. WQ 127256]